MNEIFIGSYKAGLANLTNDRDSKSAEEAKLKDACMEFEAIMTSMFLKQGLKSAQEAGFSNDGDDERDSGTKQYMDFVNEQMAYFVGKQGMLGLGDHIYKNVSERIKNTVSGPVNNKEEAGK